MPTPFGADFDVDYDAIGRMVRRALHYGVRIFSLTGGNSLYDSLSYEEIKEVTRVLVKAVDDLGVVIAATGAWWTARAVDHAQFADRVGADAVQVNPPRRSGGEDHLFRHFQAMSESTSLALGLHGNFSPSLLEKLTALESVVVMKEDLELTNFIDRQIEFGDHISIFAGGAENRFLVGYPYGAKAFYSTYSSFAPDVAMLFWEAIREDDWKKVVEVTKRYDYPFIRRFSHEFWHATLEHFGVAARFLRPPMRSYSDEEMEDVKAFFDRHGLDPGKYQ